MNYFDTINKYYQLGKYTIDQVKVFVKAGRITKEEFKIITGEDYS